MRRVVELDQTWRRLQDELAHAAVLDGVVCPGKWVSVKEVGEGNRKSGAVADHRYHLADVSICDTLQAQAHPRGNVENRLSSRRGKFEIRSDALEKPMLLAELPVVHPFQLADRVFPQEGFLQELKRVVSPDCSGSVNGALQWARVEGVDGFHAGAEMTGRTLRLQSPFGCEWAIG